MDRSESIRRQFGASADRYRTSAYHSDSPDLDALCAAARLTGTERVLDIGTGTGFTALALAPGAARVVGLDLTPAMLDQARRLASERGLDHVEFHEGDAHALPFAEDHFDVVSCRVCAHHFADAALVVREAARVLRPGGRVLWVDSVAPEDAAQDTFMNCVELLRDPSHVRDYTTAQWQAMFADAGLTATWEGTWGSEQPFDAWTERMQTPAEERAALRRLFLGATAPIREVFGIVHEPLSWTIPVALLRAA